MFSVDAFLADLGLPVLHTGAPREALSKIEQVLGTDLPHEYVELMRRTNGVEGFVSHDHYIIFWPAEELLELNHGYGVEENRPGLWLFGSNGGDAGYAFDTACCPMAVKELAFIDLCEETVGVSFEEFIQRLKSG